MENPRIYIKNGSITIEFLKIVQQPNPKSLEMVIDFDQQDEILGIEILNLFFQAGEKSLDVIKMSTSNQGDGLRYAYDEKSDAFWLQLKKGKSLHQIPVMGTVFLDNKGQIISLNADVLFSLTKGN